MKTIHLRGKGQHVALVDDADYDFLSAFKWHAHPMRRTVYAQRALRRPDGGWTTQYMHVLMTGWRRTDHINGDGLDNRRANLREVTNVENARNSRIPRQNTSGFKGVTRDGSRWRARIGVNYRNRIIGWFRTPEEAALAYDQAARELFGEHAALNFPLIGERSAHA